VDSFFTFLTVVTQSLQWFSFNRYTSLPMSSLVPLPNPELLPIPESETERCELDQVLQSRAFEKTPTLRKLLTYMWEHRGEDVSEYAIATDALGRRPDFDPRLDATVRVLVLRLRQRLKEFYETEGARLATRITVPVGTHQVQIIHTEPEVSAFPIELINVALAPAKVPAQRASGSPRIVWFQAGVILLLLVSNAWMFLQKQHRHDPVESLPAFWQQFLGNGKLTRIVVPNPVFFGWSNGLIARDITVNDFSHSGDSVFLRDLQQRFGSPNLSQHYASAPDVFASNRLGPYLDPAGGHVMIASTSDVSASDLERDNLILLGTPNTLAPLQSILDRLSFHLDVNSKTVTDSRSRPGMLSAFGTVQQSETRITTPGIIACLPGGSAGTHVLVLMTTYYTNALVAYLTSENGMKDLHAALAAHGNPPYFEAVISAELEGSTPLKEKLIELRRYTPQP
jgi:hypothetical protein